MRLVKDFGKVFLLVFLLGFVTFKAFPQAQVPFCFPTEGTLGWVFNEGHHEGVDIWTGEWPNDQSPPGNQVYLPYRGKLIDIGDGRDARGRKDGIKQYLVFRHQIDPTYKDFVPQLAVETWYFHMADQDTGVSYVNPDLRVGQEYPEGTLLGTQGNRKWNQGSTKESVITHLHFEVRYKGVPIDPSPYLGYNLNFNNNPLPKGTRFQITCKPNRLPIANAGDDQTMPVNSIVQLNGRGSFDPDGDEIKSYQWTILPRENSARCIFITSNRIVNPKVQPQREGSCTIELQVTDARGARSVPDQVVVTVRQDITPPGLIQNFQASDNEDSRSTLTWTNPSDSDLAEIIVRRKLGSYPTNYNDSDLVYQNASPTPGAAVTHTDTGLTNGTTYYYAVFSRDRSGNWNDQVVEGKNADTGRPQAPPVVTQHPWPMFQRDGQRSGRSPHVGPQGPNVKWTFQDNSIPFWEPVVAADGTIYVGGGYTGDLGGFYAINPDGSLKWVNNSIRVLDSAALGPDGQIYVIAYAYPENHPFLLALNPDGTERWRYEWFSVDYYGAELVIDQNGNIYHLTGCYSQSDQRVHPSLLAFNPQGSIIWLYDITDRQTYPNGVCAVSGLALGGSASSALDKEGNIYAVVSFHPEFDGTILFALRPDGTEKWRRTFNYGWAGISIDQDGTLYVSVAGKIHAIDPSSPNQDKWVVYVQGLGSAVTIGAEDIYVTGGSAPDGTWRSYLYAFDKQGNAKWQKFIGYGETSVPILGGDGTIYIGARQWMVYAFRPDGIEKWSSNECAASSNYFAGAGGSLAIAANGTLYTAGPQKLCAFGESVAGSTSAPGEVLAMQADPGSVRFLAAEAMALRVEVFNLAGRRIYDSGLVSGNSLHWDGLMSDGHRPANGVYLYVVTIRKQDGTILRSQVKKLVILR